MNYVIEIYNGEKNGFSSGVDRGRNYPRPFINEIKFIEFVN